MCMVCMALATFQSGTPGSVYFRFALNLSFSRVHGSNGAHNFRVLVRQVSKFAFVDVGAWAAHIAGRRDRTRNLQPKSE